MTIVVDLRYQTKESAYVEDAKPTNRSGAMKS